MRIQHVSIHNFRSIKAARFNLLPYMVFVGKNNSGKSNLMIALDAFFNDSVIFQDFFSLQDAVEDKLTIKVQFTTLNDHEKEIYKGKLLNEGSSNEHLILRYTAELSADKASVKNTQYEYKKATIDLEKKGYKDKYGGLFEKNIYKSIKKIRDHTNIPDDFKENTNKFLEGAGKSRFNKGEFTDLRDTYIKRLLQKHPNMATHVYQPIKIPKSRLKDYLGTFFFIPAVQDVEDETRYSSKGKKNLNNLMNYVLDKIQDEKKKRQKEGEIQEVLKEIYQIGESDSEISKLRDLLNEKLRPFDNACISFDTELPNLSRLIRESLKIYIDDGIKTEIQYKGHGLQRYFMVILFEVWSEKLNEKRQDDQEDPEGSTPTSASSISTSTFFAIEEPELFLHPQYQRMMCMYLQNISQDDSHQVILNTHSPDFIEFDNIMEVAKVTKTRLSDGTQVIQPLQFDEEGNVIKKPMVRTWGHPMQREKHGKINRLNMSYYLDPTRNELFFADKVVLVEGQTEKMLFPAWADYFFGDDIALVNSITYVDCYGKFNFQQFIKVLKEFQIPFLAIIDSDTDKDDFDPKKNEFIKRDTLSAGGLYFELDPEFEAEFGIEESEEDSHGKRAHKPYYAFKQFFELDGSPIESELEKIKNSPKLQSIFKAIYDRDIS